MGIQKLVVGVAESEELGNRNICRTSTLAVRRIALLVGKKSGEKNFFFSDVAKKIGKTWQKSVEKTSKKSWTRNVLVKKFHFSSTTIDQIFNQMKNAVITVTIRSLKSG